MTERFDHAMQDDMLTPRRGAKARNPALQRQGVRLLCVLTVLLPLACVGAEPPWPGTYKLRPTEKEKLTPADFPGPDGIVYPDWTYAGVPGGIPNVSVVAKIEDFGGRADDDRDDADALERGAEEVGKRGGGALLLGAGTYHLNRPVMITRDGVVLRGAGAGRTKLIFRYDVSPNGVAFFQPKPNATVTRDTPLGVIESVKAAVDLYAPVTGTVAEVNAPLAEDFGPLGADPYGKGWMVKIRVAGAEALAGLLGPKEYQAHLEAEGAH